MYRQTLWSLGAWRIWPRSSVNLPTGRGIAYLHGAERFPTLEQAVGVILALMRRVKIPDLTVLELLDIVSAFEAAETRMGSGTAPVLRLAPRGVQ